MLDMYWQPNRHYEPMKNLDHSLFIEKERRDLCVTCHEEATPGVVSDWRSSGHKNPKSTPYLSARTAEIEKRTNRVLNEVHCFDCHADTKTKQIRMPTGEVCGECHRPQFDDFLREREVGRPNHVQSWEANTIVPWYAEAARRGYLYGQHGCDQCHSGAEKCDVCHTRHKFSAAEGRQPEACISCHMGPDHPDSESYGESKHGVIYEKEEDHFDFNRPLSEVRPRQGLPHAYVPVLSHVREAWPVYPQPRNEGYLAYGNCTAKEPGVHLFSEGLPLWNQDYC